MISNPAFLNALLARSLETSVKSKLDSYLDLFKLFVFPKLSFLELFHSFKIGLNRILDVFQRFFFRIPLRNAAWKARTVHIIAILTLVENNIITKNTFLSSHNPFYTSPLPLSNMEVAP